MKIYLVGGAIRDELLGLPIKEKDWVVVGATPEEMIDLGYKPVGSDFPVFLHPVTKEEYALARTERKSGTGHKGFVVSIDPNISLEEDLKRRDLTINAIAKTENGDLIDPYKGKEDINNKVLTSICLRRTLKNGNTQLAFSEKTNDIDKYIKMITSTMKPYGPINFQLQLTERGPVIFEINPRFSGTTPIRSLFGVNEVEALIEALMSTGLKGKYRKKEGVVVRYFENQFIPWDKYQGYS